MLGEIISGALNFFGKQEDRKSAEHIAAQNIAAQQQANAQNIAFQEARNAVTDAQWERSFGTGVSQWERSFGESLRQFDRNLAKQEEFAKMGIQWKVKDALAAGLHPLYALGGGATFSPAAMVGASGGGASTAGGAAPRVEAALRSGVSGSAGGDLARMGQDITRAMMAAETAEQRQMTRTMNALSLEKAGLENDLLRSQIARNNAGQIGPPFPGSAQVPPGVQEGPLKITVPAPANAGQEPGGIPGLGYDVSEHGGTKYYYPVPSKDVKERIEDMHGPEFMWALRNNYLPSVGLYRSPPAHVPLERGHEWSFHPMLGYYQHVPRKWLRGYFGYQ